MVQIQKGFEIYGLNLPMWEILSGMADRSCERLTYIDQYGVDLDTVYFHGGPVGTIGKSEIKDEWDLYDAHDIRKKLQCKRLDGHFDVSSFIHK